MHNIFDSLYNFSTFYDLLVVRNPVAMNPDGDPVTLMGEQLIGRETRIKVLIEDLTPHFDDLQKLYEQNNIIPPRKTKALTLRIAFAWSQSRLRSIRFLLKG